jgi:hypothetical protein
LGELKNAGVVEFRNQHIDVTDAGALERIAKAVR